jgi:hypothetical protein
LECGSAVPLWNQSQSSAETGAPSEFRVQRLCEKLDNSEFLRTDGTLSANFAVRSIAVTCLEAMTGAEFSLVESGKRLEVMEILTYRKGDTAWRFQVPTLADKEFAQIKVAASFWVEGYKRGAAETGRQAVSHK